MSTRLLGLGASLTGLALLAHSAHATPLPFEPDGGTYRGAHLGCRLELGPARMTWTGPEGRAASVSWGDSDAGAALTGERPIPVRRYVGDDPAAWSVTSAYTRLVWRDAWPGVDMSLDVRAQGFERDLLVAPGADPTVVRLRVEGAAAQIDAEGRLVIAHPDCPIVESAPIGWQDGERGRDMVQVAWDLADDGELALRVDAWDPARPLLIDPVIPSGGLLGATLHEDTAHDVVIAPNGETYVAGGLTNYRSGTLTHDAFVVAFENDFDLMWVIAFGGTKDNLLPPTCAEYTVPGDPASACKTWQAHTSGLGGNDDAIALTIVGDRLAVVGHTYATDFSTLDPFIATSPLGPAPTPKGRRDGFVVMLDRASGERVMSSYLGGDDDDQVSAVQALDDQTFVVLGGTRSPDWGSPTYQPPFVPNLWTHYAYAFTIKRSATAPERWLPAPHFAPSPLVGVQPSGRATFNALHMVAGEPWFLGEHEGKPLRWRLAGKNRPAPTTDYLGTSGGAAIVQAFTLPPFEAGGMPRTMLVGNVAGTLGGFDGAACELSRSPCGGLPCGMTDAFVAFLSGDRCSDVIYLGGSLGDVLFGAAHARYAPDRDFLVLAGRTASTDLRARAAIQRQAGQPAGNGVDAFYAVIDVPNVTLKILSYVGGAPDLTRSYPSSDDVATGVALGPNREATLVGMTRTSFAEFAKEISTHVPLHEAEAGQAFVARLPIEVADLNTTITVEQPVLAQNATTPVVVTVKNEGTIEAQGVSLLFELDPTGLTVASPPAGCTQNASPLSWTCRPPSGVIGESANHSFTIVLKAPAANYICGFVATAKTTSHDPNRDNNAAVGEVRVGGIDFRPRLFPKEPTPAPAVVGMHQSALVELFVNNRGGEPARARVEVTATQQLIVAVGPDVAGCTATACDEGKTCLPLTCDGPLQNNDTSPLEWRAKDLSLELLEPYSVPGPETTVVVTAKTSPLDGKTDFFPSNDTATLPITFREPDIVAVSAVITPKIVPWSGAATLSLVARDDGPGHTNSVEVLFDPSPFVPGALPPRCVFDSGRIQCAQDRPELGAIAVGQVYTMDIPLVAPAKDDTQVAREVTLSPKWIGTGADPKPANNTAQAKAWLGAVDVRVEPPNPLPTLATFKVVETTWGIQNHASDVAHNVVVSQTFSHPNGLEVAIARVSGEDCPVTTSPTTVTATCTIAELGAGQRVNMLVDVKARGRGDVGHGTVVTTTELNASAALYPTVRQLVAIGPDVVSDLSIVDLELPPGVVRGAQRSLVFSAVNRGPGASPPGGSTTVIDMSFGSTGLTSSDAALGCTWAPLLLPTRYGTRITCKPQFDGSADQRLETTFTITPNYRGINQVLANATDPNEEKPLDNVKSLVFDVEGAKLKPTLSGPAKVEVDVPFALDLKIVSDGWADAKPVEAVLTFPADRLELVGAAPAGCQATPGRVQCTDDLLSFDQVTHALQLRGKTPGTARITGLISQPSDPNEKQFALTADVEIVGPDIAVTHVASRPSSWLTPPQVGEVDFRVKNQSATVAVTGARVIARVASATGEQTCQKPHDPITSSVHSGACTAGNVSAAGAEYACDLAPGAEAILRLSASAACPGKTVLEVNANTGVPELDTTNNRETATVLSREPKLGLRFETDMGTLPIEGPYDELLIGNVLARDLSGYGVGAGPDPADRIRIDLSVPSPFKLEALATTGGTCSLGNAASPPHCLLTSIGQNGVVPITFGVRSTHGPARRTIRADASGLVIEATSATADLVAQGPDLALSVVSAPAGKVVDDRGEWVIKVENVGPAPAEHAAISFTEPNTLIDMITVDGVSACSASATGRVCTLPGGSIAAGASAQVTLGARLKKAGDVSIPARATSRYQPDANAANDAVALTTKVLGPDLAVTLALSPDAALVGNAVGLQLSVQNVGSTTSDATTATIQLGALVSVSSLAPGCTLQQGVAHCNIPALTTGQTEVLSSQIAGTRPGVITLTARAKLGDDANPNNDTDTALLTITSADADGDGTPDGAEDQGPNGGDANRDGTQDSTQPHVTTIVIPKYGPFIAESADGTTLIITPSNNPSSPPAGTKAPLAPVGTFSFKIYGVTPGARATVKFTFPAGVPAQSWWKYNNATQQWSEFTWDAATQTGAVVKSARVLEVTVQDDGRGDEDPTDGVIEDPGTPLLPVVTVGDAGDADDASPGDGACATAGGTCTLRAAILEINASGIPRYVVFDFDAPTIIEPATPLPTLTTPAVIDGSGVPGPDAFEPGLTLSGLDLGAGRLLELGVPACALIGVKLADVGGHGLVITQPAARVADSWLGRPLYGTGLAPTEQASVRADGATDLMIADSWVGRINGVARYGLDLAGEDIRLDGVRVNVDPREGRRLMGDVSTGVRLRGTTRARIDRLVVNGANVGVHASGDGTGAVLRGSLFGLGANGECNAFTRDDPGLAEDGRGPCLERNLQGLVLDGASGWTIGGLDVSERNAFGDHYDAILVTGGSHHNHIYNNLVGLAADGTCQPAPDLGVGTSYDGLCRLYNVRGLAVVDGHDNVIGAPGAGNVFGVGTLELSGSSTTDNLVKSNFIGLFADLVTPVKPGFTAQIQTAFQVGGGATGTTIDDNTMSGLYVVGAGTNDTVITNNRIGLLPSGLALPGPDADFDTYWRVWPSGVLVQDGPSGVTLVDNTIADTFEACVRIESLYGDPVSEVVAQDNLLGLTADGRAVTACEGGAVGVRAVHDALLDGNVVGHCGSAYSASLDLACVRLRGGARGAEVRDNVFGLLRDGRDGPWGAVTPLPNPLVIVADAPASLVVGNFMLGAPRHAIYDVGGDLVPLADGTRIVGNRVGVDPDGARRGGPSDHGILAVGAHAQIGGVNAGEGNTIVGAGGAGIQVGAVSGVAIRGNALDDNAGLGISLGGTTPITNDTLDGDGGPNGSQNHPVVGAFDAGSTSVATTLSSAANTTYVIDVYGVASPDPSGHGEADVFLGSAELTTDGSGQGSANVTLSRAPNPGEYLTAIATGPDGSSEFGPSVEPIPGPEADLALTIYGEGAAVDQWGFIQATVENTGPDVATDIVVSIELPVGLELGAEDWISSGTCTPRTGGLDCFPPDLGNGEIWEAAYLVRSDSAGTYPVAATVESATRDPDASDDRTEADLLVGPVHYLILQTDYTDYRTYATGESVPITSTVACYPGFSGTIEDLAITLTVPSGTSLVTSAPSCTVAGTLVTCDLGDLTCANSDPVKTTTLNVSLAFSQGGSHVVVVEATSPAPNTEGPQVVTLRSLTVTAPPPALSIALSGPTAALPTGTLETWTATLSNSGATPLTDVELVVTPPAGMVFRGANAPCAPLGEVVICLPASIPATGSLPVALAFDVAPADGTLTTCARRVAGDTLLEEHCDDLAVTVAPFNRTLTTSTPVVTTAAGRPATLGFSVTSATGAPAGTIVLTPSGDLDGVYAPSCSFVDDAWRCAFDALAPGGEARVALEVVHDAAAAITWQASLDGADAGPLDDATAAALLVSPASSCAPWSDVVGFAEGGAAALTAAGFTRRAPTADAPLGWASTGATGSLTTPSVSLPSAASALWLSWFDARAFDEGTVARVELSTDAGQTWVTVHDAAPADETSARAVRIDRATLGDGALDVRARWRVEDGEPGAWHIDRVTLTSCEPAPTSLAVALDASPAFSAVARDALATTAFRVDNEGAEALEGAELTLAIDRPELLVDVGVDGGACTLDARGARCALPPIAPGGSATVVASGASADDARVALAATLAAPVTLAGTTAASASWRIGSPAGDGARLTWQPGAVTVAPGGSGGATLEVAGRDGGVFPGGVVTITPAPGLVVAPGSGECAPAGDVIACAVPMLPPGEARALPLTVSPVGAERVEIVAASWQGDGASAQADLSVGVDMGGALSLAFEAPASPPAALTPTIVTLVVVAAGDVTAGARVVIEAGAGVTLRSVTGPGASCAALSGQATCELPAIAQAAPLALAIELVVEDAGPRSLFGALALGPAGVSPSALLTWVASRDCAAFPCASGACDGATCDAALGCRASSREGLACEPEGLACARDGVCVDGACVTVGGVCPGADVCEAWQLDCDDDDPCTNDACDPFVGCVNEPASDECCDDADCPAPASSCAVAVCEGGVCGATPVGDGAGCDADGSACTVGDACVGGVCVAGQARDCDDGDPCTIDACSPATGCTHAASDDPACTCVPLRADAACQDGDVAWRDGCGEAGDVAVACDDGDPETDDRCVEAQDVCLRVPVGRDDCDTACAGAWTQACEDGHLVWLDPCGVTAGVALACASADRCAATRCDEALVACVSAPLDEGACAPAGGCDATRALACEGAALVWRDGCGATIGVAQDCARIEPGVEGACDPDLLACMARRDDAGSLPSRPCEVGPGDVEGVEIVEAAEPEVTEPEVTEPEVAEPEVTEPEVAEPEVTEPEVTEPEVTGPEVAEPEVTEPEVTEPAPDVVEEGGTEGVVERSTSGDDGCGCGGGRAGSGSGGALVGGLVVAALWWRRREARASAAGH
ncbi:MAG: hypothetical protein IT385_00240 [Deltaproteobacteria bacterium]|nr:hypothetical protein [Deltaproteobacteria bacterium]